MYQACMKKLARELFIISADFNNSPKAKHFLGVLWNESRVLAQKTQNDRRKITTDGKQ